MAVHLVKEALAWANCDFAIHAAIKGNCGVSYETRMVYFVLFIMGGQNWQVCVSLIVDVGFPFKAKNSIDVQLELVMFRIVIVDNYGNTVGKESTATPHIALFIVLLF
jgi:hypothetical protein